MVWDWVSSVLAHPLSLQISRDWPQKHRIYFLCSFYPSKNGKKMCTCGNLDFYVWFLAREIFSVLCLQSSQCKKLLWLLQLDVVSVKQGGCWECKHQVCYRCLWKIQASPHNPEYRYSQYSPRLSWTFLGKLPLICIISQSIRRMSSQLTGSFAAIYAQRAELWPPTGEQISTPFTGFDVTKQSAVYHWDQGAHSLLQIAALLRKGWL